MIDRASIMAWAEQAPWTDPAMVEQDLIICRALVDIFSDDFLKNELAFRGGTALHKLYLQPQPRYSEDIDLVQINPGPIKPILFRLGEVLGWMPDRVTKPKRYNNTVLFRMESEVPPVQPIRLKIEINCFEHFNVLGLRNMPFSVDSNWFRGDCEITTYAFEELLGTKLRALYQRKKGRDLFDLQVALDKGSVDAQKVMDCYNRYMDFSVGKPPSYKQFMQNMELKMQDSEFLGDTELLLRPDADKFDPERAFQMVRETFIDRLPGRRR
ncbi:nucleotidyl transferase AbiEii/AbiGii toxin family protein [Fibrobacter sp.]|uniref:nucleotidyl transferase AbiEii/AbiGii toxin family protein n=1 Tax=Fibrobacter sp. TaxID=35828 RepID=UPI00387016D6